MKVEKVMIESKGVRCLESWDCVCMGGLSSNTLTAYDFWGTIAPPPLPPPPAAAAVSLPNNNLEHKQSASKRI